MPMRFTTPMVPTITLRHARDAHPRIMYDRVLIGRLTNTPNGTMEPDQTWVYDDTPTPCSITLQEHHLSSELKGVDVSRITAKRRYYITFAYDVEVNVGNRIKVPTRNGDTLIYQIDAPFLAQDQDRALQTARRYSIVFIN